jgi:hypothetical protein
MISSDKLVADFGDQINVNLDLILASKTAKIEQAAVSNLKNMAIKAKQRRSVTPNKLTTNQISSQQVDLVYEADDENAKLRPKSHIRPQFKTPSFS